jgi:hypothetical protein
VHFSLRRPGSVFRRAARRLRAAVPFVHQIFNKLDGDKLYLPYMQINTYDEGEIQRHIRKAVGREALVRPRNQGDIKGALFVAKRRPR